MLDYVLTFSLEKLVFDDELCGQALHFCREFAVMEDLPTVDLVRQLLAEKHLLTAAHTLSYWPRELYLPGPVFDRINRETWLQQGSKSLEQRVKAEVERLLGAYSSPPTDARVDAELIALIKAGLTTEQPLPEILPPVERARSEAGREAGREARRGRRSRRPQIGGRATPG
jgi:trimethylamine--corrinoid protein Co-methyltransferase